MDTEAAILERAARGDRAAWDRLVRLHEPFARSLAGERLRRSGFGNAEADEVVQDVWTAFWEGDAHRLKAVDPARGFRSYLAGAVLNAARMRIRSGARRAAREASHAFSEVSVDAPDEPLLRSEEADRVEAALSRLPASDQLALRWAYWEGLPYARIARLLGVEENSVGPVLSRARERMRECLKPARDVGAKA